jgi:polar amino acid transport system substrate-binding protein
MPRNNRTVMGRNLTCSAALSLAIAATSALAQTEETIVFDAVNVPFMFQKDGQANGLYPALVREAFRRTGVSVKMKALPWKRAIAGIDAGSWGICCLYMNKQRLDKYDYSAPVFEEKLTLYVKKGSTITYKSIDDLNGLVVGVMPGWSYGDVFDKAAASGALTKHESENDISLFKMLLTGRVDIVISTSEVFSLLRTEFDKNNEIIELEKPLAHNKTYLAFNKSTNKMGLIHRFNNVVQKIAAEGLTDKLARENFTEKQ